MLSSHSGVSDSPKPGCSGAMTSNFSASCCMTGRTVAPDAPCKTTSGMPAPPRISRLRQPRTASTDVEKSTMGQAWRFAAMASRRSVSSSAKADYPAFAGFNVVRRRRVYWMPAFAGMTRLKQKITLRHRQHVGRRAGEQFAVGAHLVGLRINFDIGRSIVMDHALLGNFSTRILHRVKFL